MESITLHPLWAVTVKVTAEVDNWIRSIDGTDPPPRVPTDRCMTLYVGACSGLLAIQTAMEQAAPDLFTDTWDHRSVNPRELSRDVMRLEPSPPITSGITILFPSKP